MDQNIPYRQGVQACIIKDDKVLIASSQSRDSHWKFPSGGMEKGEVPEETLKREMLEELSVDVKILKKCPFKNVYLWPREVCEIYDNKYKGQEQHVFICTIDDPEAIVPDPEEIEHHKWVPLEDVEEHFRSKGQKEAARKVIEEYRSLESSKITLSTSQ